MSIFGHSDEIFGVAFFIFLGKEELRMNDSKVIAICNQKGGVGKTTTTVNLGVGLAQQGKRVLLIDADPQSDLTVSLGWKDNDNLKETLATQIERIIKDEDFVTGQGILKSEEGVELLPSNLDLSAMEMVLVNTMSRETAMREYIKQIRDRYDYILIDCMPSLGMITINALTAADSVIIPVQAQYLPAKGMTQLIQTINKVRKTINPNLEIDGIVLTLVDGRTNLAKGIENTLRQSYGKFVKIYDAAIPIAVKAAEATERGESIHAYDRNSPVSKAYEALSKEVISDAGKERHKLRDDLSR